MGERKCVEGEGKYLNVMIQRQNRAGVLDLLCHGPLLRVRWKLQTLSQKNIFKYKNKVHIFGMYSYQTQPIFDTILQNKPIILKKNYTKY